MSSLSPRCPIRTTLELVGGKWKLLILKELLAGPQRPSALRTLIPEISEKVLWRELQQLIDNRLVEKRQIEAKPAHTEYFIPEHGPAIGALLEAMAKFAQQFEEKLTD